MTRADEDTAQSHADALPPPDESTLWLVSFGDDDDREMRAPEIAQSLRRGEIKADTIVWREGLPEWVSLSSIPMLARLLVTSGETRAAPAAVLGKIPLVQREEPPKTAEAATATPLGIAKANPEVTAQAPLVGATPGPSTVATLAGTARRPLPSTPDEKAVETPAWKGKTRIGLPKVEVAPQTTAEVSPKAPVASAPLPATGTPMPATTKAATATGTPMPATTKAAIATGTPMPVTTKAATALTPSPAGTKPGISPTTADVTSKTSAQGAAKPVTSASKGAFTPLEPKRPEARAMEPKFGAKPLGTPKPGTPAPRTTVPKAAPVPGAKTPEAAPAEARAPSPKLDASAPTANVPASSPTSTDELVEIAATSSERIDPELKTLPEATFGDSDEDEKTPPRGTSPEPPKAVSPEPPKAAPELGRTATRKEPPKGPPPRHRDPAPPGAKPPAPKPDARAPKTGAAYIWEDAEAVNVDPESVRPPPPVHAIAEARAQGPGLKKKTAPKPPSPPKRATPSIPVDTDEETIPIPMARPVDEGAHTDAPEPFAPEPVPFATLALPTIEEFANTPAIPPIDTTPTVPRETRSDRAAKPAASVKPASTSKSEPAPKAAAVTSVASTPPPQEKRKSLFPFVLLGAAAAAVALTFALKKQPQTEPVAVSEPPQPTTEVVTQPPAEPEAPTAAPSTAPVETTAPAVANPAPTAPHVAVAEPAPKNPTTSVVTSAAPKAETTPKPATTPKPESTPRPEPTPKPESSKPVAAAPAQPQVSDVGGDFDRAAASAALGSAAGAASSCRKGSDPAGVAVVHVTFANSGRATRALVEGPPFAGTATGGCIADALRNAKVPPYGGDRVTVTKRVVIQ